jgi:hypothetical protein
MAKNRLPDSGGHDIVIWQKKEQAPTWAVGYSKSGIDYIQGYIPEYEGGKVELSGRVEPEEFMGKAPKDIKIGVIIPGTRTLKTMHPPHLH